MVVMVVMSDAEKVAVSSHLQGHNVSSQGRAGVKTCHGQESRE